MLEVTVSLLDWLQIAINQLDVVISSWIIQAPLIVWYVFRLINLFTRIIPSE